MQVGNLQHYHFYTPTPGNHHFTLCLFIFLIGGQLFHNIVVFAIDGGFCIF